MTVLPTKGPDFASFPVTGSGRRFFYNAMFMAVCWITTAATLLMLAILLTSILWKSLPVFQSRPDTLISNCWAKIVQGENADNDPATIDEGDLLQGLFVAERLAVGGLSEDDDIDFSATKSQIGIFSFRLVPDVSNPARFECRAADGKDSVIQILAAAGFKADNLSLFGNSLQSAVIAICESDNVNWDIRNLDGGQGLLSDGRIGGLLDGKTGWDLMWAAGRSDDDNDFCELIFDDAVFDQDSESDAQPAVSASKAQQLRARRKLGRLTGLFSVLGHESAEVSFGQVKNRKAGSDSILAGDLAIRDKDVRFTGLANADKHGFDFGGKFRMTHDFRPDQGSAFGHFASFVRGLPKNDPNEAAIGPALAGTLWVCLGCALFALPLGIGTAICLEEFKPKNRWLLRLHSLVQLNITNLAGVPSIVYGIVGLTVFGNMIGFFGLPSEPAFEFGATHYFQYSTEGGRFVRVAAIRGTAADDEKWMAPPLVNGMDALLGDERVKLNVIQPTDELPDDPELLGRTLYFDAEGGPQSDKEWYYIQLPFGRSVLAASLTLMLVILPVIIIASQEALRAVPQSLRQGAQGLGATRWQTVRNVSLPAAIPSVMTGAILAMSRAIGEAAPIIVLAGTVRISAGPQHLMDSYSVLPVQLFYWAGQPIDQLDSINWQNVVSAGILVLLIILFSFNAVAVTIRHWTQKPLS